MLLAIDVGNTDAVFGFFEGDELRYKLRIKAPQEEQNLVYYEYRFRNFLLENDLQSIIFDKVIISSVVPSLTEIFVTITQSFCSSEPSVIVAASYPLVSIGTDDPNELGTDLFANAVSAHTRYKSNCVIVDFGTALTFTVVSDQAKVIGVAIAPGLKTAVNSLFSKTAQLPEVPLKLPGSVLGKNTIHAIQAGILYGYEGMVKNILQRIKSELAEPCIVLATGGLSSVIETLANEFDEIDPDLTLNGIRIIGEYDKIIAK